MLVLSRKPHESIRIGDDIVVTVCMIGPASVRLGITAPENMPILRDDAVETRPREDRAAERTPKIKLFSP